MGEQKQREKYYASRIKSNLTHRLQCVKAAQGEAERKWGRGAANTLQRRLAECALNASPSSSFSCSSSSRWLLSCALPLSLLVLFACLSKGHVALDMSGDKHTHTHECHAHTPTQTCAISSGRAEQSSAARAVGLRRAWLRCGKPTRYEERSCVKNV